MIRPFIAQDLDKLMPLWLAATIDAHPFIDAEYWRSCETLVRNDYLPVATTWVYIQDRAPVGFISVLDQRFIGALFVSRHARGKGIGKALIEQVQQTYPFLLLEVYQLNVHACQFYQRCGFQKISQEFNRETKHITQIMQWPFA